MNKQSVTQPDMHSGRLQLSRKLYQKWRELFEKEMMLMAFHFIWKAISLIYTKLVFMTVWLAVESIEFQSGYIIKQ